MNRIWKQGVVFALVLVLLVGIMPGAMAASMPKHNDGDRHQVCDQLSNQAKSYYEGKDSWENLKALPGVATDSSLAAMKGELYNELQDFMDRTMTDSVSYRSLTKYWPYTDSVKGSSEAVLFYSDFVGSGYNREHVWPKSRASFREHNGGCDLHHLRPTDTVVNSTRNNYTMGNVRELCGSDYSTKTNGGKTVLYYNASRDLVEVNDNIKGDVARVMLYVYTRWGQPNLTENVSAANLPPLDSDDKDNNGLKVMYDLDTLLQWCEMDPVDEWEMCRNDRVQDVQGNRNVFIDYPELAWLMFDREIPQNMPTPSGEGSEMGKPKFEVTAKSSNETWGTVTVSGYRITAQPVQGYEAVNATVEPAGAAKITRRGNVFTLSQVTQDVTVTVNFGERTEGTIQYVVPEGVTVKSPTTKAYLNDEITMPQVEGNPADKTQEYHFEGWVEAAVSDTTDLDGVNVVKAETKYTVSRRSTVFYALYSYQEHGQGQANVFDLVTQAPASWEGEYVMMGGEEYVHLATGENVGATDAAMPIEKTGITKTGTTLSGVTETYVIVVEKQPDGNYSMKLKGAAEDTYFSYTGSKNTLSTSGSVTDREKWKITCNAGDVNIENVGTPGRFLQFNQSAKMFRCYTGSQQPVHLYASFGAILTHYLTLSEKGECKHEHTELRNAAEATCTEVGYTGDLVCKDCGAVVTPGKTIDALGHDWGEWEQVEVPTTEKEGKEVRECSRCHSKEERAVSKLPVIGFTDVTKGDYFYTPVQWAVENGITQGVGGGRFAPNSSCTRAQMVTFLWRAAKCPEPVSTENPFTDVKDAYYTKAVLWAVEEGITKGVAQDRFAPNSYCTREQMVTFLWRAQKSHEPQTVKNPFTDVNENSGYYKAILWAVENHITEGVGEGRFSPKGLCTRGQMVTFLCRVYGK